MEERLRSTGLDILGNVPWGTHLCYFYETKQDLLDTLIPYFKAGLEGNEFCLCIASDPLTAREATNALREAVPELDKYIEGHGMEILPYAEWYLQDGKFDPARVIESWYQKLNKALKQGYEGMRVNGNEDWLEREVWKDFIDYERELNSSIAGRRMIVLCTYPVSKCSASDVLDIARAHETAVAKRQGLWEVVEVPELRQTKAQIKRQNAELEKSVAERTQELRVANETLREEISGRKLAEAEIRHLASFPRFSPLLIAEFSLNKEALYLNPAMQTTIRQLAIDDPRQFVPPGWDGIVGTPRGAQIRELTIAGRVFEEHLLFIPDFQSLLLYATDITRRKQTEGRLEESERRFRTAVQDAPFPIALHAEGGEIITLNTAWSHLSGYTHADVPTIAAWVEKAYGERKDIVRKVIDKLYALERPTHEGEYRIRCKDGTERTWDFSTTPLGRLPDGRRLVMGMAVDVTQRKEVENQLRNSQTQLRALMHHLHTVVEDERARIAREIHDDIGQLLTAIKMRVSLLPNTTGETKETLKQNIGDEIKSIVELVDQGISSMRKIIRDLRPEVFETMGLLPAIEWQARQFEKTTGIHVSLFLGPADRALDKASSTVVFRIVQEALTNVARHAKATRVEISCKITPSTFVLIVMDDGVGITPERMHAAQTFGLLGMRERASALGGTVGIHSSEGEGTVVELQIPLSGGAKGMPGVEDANE